MDVKYTAVARSSISAAAPPTVDAVELADPGIEVALFVTEFGEGLLFGTCANLGVVSAARLDKQVLLSCAVV